ncbi:MAG: hypothetical protein ACR2MO_08895 [Acidimicrobiales bacterium]
MVAVLAVSCTGAGGTDGIKPLPEETTTTHTAGPSYSVPAVIDGTYVDRVLAALDQVEGDAVRRLVASREVDDESVARLRAIYNDPFFEVFRTSMLEVAAKGVEQYEKPPGNRRTTVSELLAANPNCILITAKTDYTAVVIDPPADDPNTDFLVTLRRSQADADPEDLNPTPWSYGAAEVVRRGDRPPPDAACNE